MSRPLLPTAYATLQRGGELTPAQRDEVLAALCDDRTDVVALLRDRESRARLAAEEATNGTARLVRAAVARELRRLLELLEGPPLRTVGGWLSCDGETLAFHDTEHEAREAAEEALAGMDDDDPAVERVCFGQVCGVADLGALRAPEVR